MCEREGGGERERARRGGGGGGKSGKWECVCVLGGNKSIRVRMGERVALTEVTGNE